MFCKECGTKNDDGAKFCEVCGALMPETVNSADNTITDEQTSLLREEGYVPQQQYTPETIFTPPAVNAYEPMIADNFAPAVQPKSNKKFIIIAAVGVVVIGLAGFFIWQYSSGDKYESMMSEAETYLAKNDQKNATTTYLKVIEKSPEPDDAYIALSDIYIEQGKPEEAVALLEKGVEETKSEVLSTKLDLVKKSAGIESADEADAKDKGKDADKDADKDSDSVKIEGKGSDKIEAKDGDKIVLENKDAAKVTEKDVPNAATADPKVPGNSFANVSVGGLVVSQNGFTYYRNDGAGGSIYCMKNDGTSKKQLNSGNSYYINVVGDWIYYSYLGDGSYNLYKMKTDGSNATKLVNSKCYEPKVVDGWIYYINDSDSSTPYKVKTDGTGNVKLSTTRCNFLCIKDNFIYYSDRSSSGGGAVCKMDLNGNGKSVIYGKFSEYLNLVGDNLYFTLMDEPGVYVYSIKKDSVSKVSDIQNDSLNVSDGVMYYSDWSNDSHYLYKTNINGSGTTKLAEEPVNAINVDGDWIYYQIEDTTTVYKIKTDGTQRQAVS